MKIVCDNCSTKYSIADEKVRGKVFKIKCKKCSHIIVVKGEPTTGEGQPAGFDQKETRVFDYSGFEGQRGASAASGGAAAASLSASAMSEAADPIWHLVIDREQVGPLTLAELEQKWNAGEIEGSTYAWREGFADWQRLEGIEELAAVVKRGRPEAGRDTAGLFGPSTSTPAAGSPAPTRADPTDLFSGAGSSTEDEVSSELFGVGGAERAAGQQPAVFSSTSAPAASQRRSQKEDLFSSGIAEPVSASSPRADVRPMTAQRNENSVLFSLNNLSALAAGEPAAPAPRTSSGLGGFGSSTTDRGGAEGSGLIDIRAMAAMTLGSKKEDSGSPRERRASEDDLPVFSASSFSAPAAGVLLPTVQPASNRLVYIFMGVVGLLAVAAIVLVAVILLGKKEPPLGEAGSETAVLATSGARTDVPPPSSGSAPSTATSPSPAAVPSTTRPATPPSGSTPPASAAAAPAATPSREERPSTTPSRPERKPPTTAAPSRPSSTSERPSEPRPSEPARTPPAEASRPSQKCDEVACLVTPDLPCCPKKGQTSSRPSSSGDSSLPDRLEQSDIISGMKGVNGRVMACNDRFRVPGTFKVKVTVSADGNVSSASAGPPVAGTSAAGCVESAVRGARFKKSKNSITFNYPYTFR